MASSRAARSFARGLAVLLMARAATALADPGRAEAEFQRGEREYRQGAYAAAANDFEQAFRDDPRASVAYNAGLARQLAGQPARAADDYAQALALRDLPPAQASDAQARLQALEVSLGDVHVTASGLGARIRVADALNLPSPASVHLAPGTYDVSVAWPDGRTATRTAVVWAGGVVSLAFEPPAPEPSAATAGAPPASSRLAAHDAAAGGSQRTPWIEVAGGLGIAGLVTGTVFGAMTLNAKQTVDSQCNVGGVPTQCQSSDGAAAGNRGETYGMVSTVGFVVGGLGVATALVLWITRPRPGGAAWGWAPAPFVASDGRGGAVLGTTGRF